MYRDSTNRSAEWHCAIPHHYTVEVVRPVHYGDYRANLKDSLYSLYVPFAERIHLITVFHSESILVSDFLPQLYYSPQAIKAAEDWLNVRSLGRHENV